MTDPASSPRTVAIIQARMSSSRLPGKVLLDIAGEPMLAHVVERARNAKSLDEVVVATTTDPTDEAIAELCTRRDYPFTRGSLHDVLDRYYQAASQQRAGVIVRITADCPVIDPVEIDRTVAAFWGQTQPQDRVLARWQAPEPPVFLPAAASSGAFDFAANRLPPPLGRTFPIGLDTEVCTFSGLEQAWREASLPHHREHVMPFFYDQPERYRCLLVHHTQDFGTQRWTVDTTEDLALLRAIFTHFGTRTDFSWLEVLDLIQRQPELAEINRDIAHKHYRQVDERFKSH